jgi:hypothetical protein
VGAVKTDFGIHIIQRCTKDDAKPSDPCVPSSRGRQA